MAMHVRLRTDCGVMTEMTFILLGEFAVELKLFPKKQLRKYY